MPGPLLDPRSLAELPFAVERRDLSDEDRAREANRTRDVFELMGLKTAQDIVEMGCTGLSKGLPIADVQVLRENLAGTGVGLPCYVKADRFCLVHNTIGGLERNQRQLHVECADRISRPLTAAEAVHAQMIDYATHVQGDKPARDALMYLRGDKPLPEDVVADLQAAAEVATGAAPAAPALVSAPAPTIPFDQRQKSTVSPAFEPPTLPPSWRCTEHGSFFAPCRYCLAQALVESSLEPHLLVLAADEGRTCLLENGNTVAPHDFEATLTRLDEEGATAIALFAKIGVWRRKLTRE